MGRTIFPTCFVFITLTASVGFASSARSNEPDRSTAPAPVTIPSPSYPIYPMMNSGSAVYPSNNPYYNNSYYSPDKPTDDSNDPLNKVKLDETKMQELNDHQCANSDSGTTEKKQTDTEGAICESCSFPGTPAAQRPLPSREIEDSAKEKKARIEREAATVKLLNAHGGNGGSCASVEECEAQVVQEETFKAFYKKQVAMLKVAIDEVENRKPFSPPALEYIKSLLNGPLSPTVLEQSQNYQRAQLKQLKAQIEVQKNNLKRSNSDAEKSYSEVAIKNLNRQLEYSKQLTVDQAKNTASAKRIAAIILNGGNEIKNEEDLTFLTERLSLYKNNLPSFESQISFEQNKINQLKQTIRLKKASIQRRDGESEPEAELRQFEQQQKYLTNGLMKKAGFKSCGLTLVELAAINFYTGAGSSMVNTDLRAGGKKAESWKPFLDVINHAFKKLNPYQGTVARGAFLPDNVLKEHQPGNIVTYAAFTSTSADKDHSFPGQKFVIFSKSGRWVNPYSDHPNEMEVLFNAGTRFKILDRKGSEIVMEEVEP